MCTYLTVVGGSYVLHGTEAEFWPLVGVCPSSLVIQVAEVLRGNWEEEEEEGGGEEEEGEGEMRR